jgi:hypothetical protein
VLALIWVVALVALNTVKSFALSPTPANSFIDYRPGIIDLSPLGVVVEGLGMGACAYSLSSIESTTVTYINDQQGVLTEISPQSYCASLSSYESMISSLISYVVAHASMSGTYWGGVMLDEENAWGFSVAQLEALNTSVRNAMINTPGISYYYTEVFSGTGNWSQSSYNGIVTSSIPAPQISTNYMVQLANGLATNGNLVTWSTGYPSPFNTESYSDAKINGTPYSIDFYGCNCGSIYFDNRFTPA